jgi:hypothetical protein
MVLPIARIGRSLRFDPDEVRAWGLAGCPSMDGWKNVKQHHQRNEF